MSALQCFLFNLLGDRPCSGLLELALSLVELAQKGKVMKDLSPGTQCPREFGMATTKFRKSHEPKFSVLNSPSKLYALTFTDV